MDSAEMKLPTAVSTANLTSDCAPQTEKMGLVEAPIPLSFAPRTHVAQLMASAARRTSSVVLAAILGMGSAVLMFPWASAGDRFPSCVLRGSAALATVYAVTPRTLVGQDVNPTLASALAFPRLSLQPPQLQQYDIISSQLDKPCANLEHNKLGIAGIFSSIDIFFHFFTKRLKFKHSAFNRAIYSIDPLDRIYHSYSYNEQYCDQLYVKFKQHLQCGKHYSRFYYDIIRRARFTNSAGYQRHSTYDVNEQRHYSHDVDFEFGSNYCYTTGVDTKFSHFSIYDHLARNPNRPPDDKPHGFNQRYPISAFRQQYNSDSVFFARSLELNNDFDQQHLANVV
ncbi:hypothetical protein PRZ48_010100 [Zasmidium cellare]|uniref:Uncharacterized protein n=1 Tax=Zasmidium cellare TaxID=395010 RepID=A0ABR0EDN1_ZASCE|nr:hypothetical protein PRZ48_010100 [Zasmidium cellare]